MIGLRSSIQKYINSFRQENSMKGHKLLEIKILNFKIRSMCGGCPLVIFQKGSTTPKQLNPNIIAHDLNIWFSDIFLHDQLEQQQFLTRKQLQLELRYKQDVKSLDCLVIKLYGWCTHCSITSMPFQHISMQFPRHLKFIVFSLFPLAYVLYLSEKSSTIWAR